MSLKILDTFSNKKKKFIPQKNNTVKMYVCGPTVYGPDHLGHGRMGVFYDVFRRYLEYRGYEVEVVQNITDVGHLTDDGDRGEDKIEKEAKKEQKSPQEIATYYTKRHFNDMAKINVKKPTYSPRASQYIPQMIKFVEELINKGYAYEKAGNVYFRINKFEDYGKLSGKNIAELKESVRVDKDQEKENPLDFALWLKASPEHLQKWDSPWSKGYPGWHLECSVMNRELLGDTIDIHGGAIELAFPHHENEIAQSEAMTGRRFVRYWVHIGMVQVEGVKMGKSKGNFITIRQLLKQHSSDQIRLALLLTHYRKPFDYTSKRLNEAQKIVNKLIQAQKKLDSKARPKLRDKFESILDDNLNTPALISFWLENMDKMDKDLFADIKDVLGLKLVEPKLPDKIIELAEERKKLRKQNNFKQADKIRKKIEQEGYQIRDVGQDQYEIWKK